MRKRSVLMLALAVLALFVVACSQSAGDPVPVPPPSAATPAQESTPTPAIAAPEFEAAPGECTQTPPPGYTPLPADAGKGSFGAFTSTDLDGNEITQAIFAQQELTMVNIWGTFCPPCLYEMPFLGKLHKEYAARGFAVLGIVTDVIDRSGNIIADQVTYAKQLVEETGAQYTHLLPSDDLIRIKLNEVMYIPETVFVDKNGDVVGEPIVSAMDKDSWAKIIEEKLQKVGA